MDIWAIINTSYKQLFNRSLEPWMLWLQKGKCMLERHTWCWIQPVLIGQNVAQLIIPWVEQNQYLFPVQRYSHFWTFKRYAVMVKVLSCKASWEHIAYSQIRIHYGKQYNIPLRIPDPEATTLVLEWHVKWDWDGMWKGKRGFWLVSLVPPSPLGWHVDY
jgi:hypothetical protein